MAEPVADTRWRLASPVLSALLAFVLVLALVDRDWRSVAIAILMLLTLQLPARTEGDAGWVRSLRILILVGAVALLAWWAVDTF